MSLLTLYQLNLSSGGSPPPSPFAAVPFYYLRPGAEPIWAGPALRQSSPIFQLTNQTAFGSHGQVPAKQWRSDYVPDPVVQEGPTSRGVLAWLTAGGKPFANVWLDNAVKESDWTFGSQRAVVLFDLYSTPFVPQWRDNLEFTQPWQPYQGWNAAVSYWLTIGGEPFSREWRYDFIPDPSWQWTNGWSAYSAVDVLASQAPTSPFKPVWQGQPAEQIGWTFTYAGSNPLPEESTLYSISPPYQIQYADTPLWVSGPSSNPMANPPPQAQVLPFRNLWRPDTVEVQPWQWDSGQNSTPAYFFTIGGTPFSRLWRWDHVPEPVQAWVPPAATKMVAQFFGKDGQSPTKLWRWDRVPEPVWQGSPTSRGILVPLTANGEPFSKDWRWDYVPPPNWQWTPPNTTLLEPTVGKPFARLWREDLVSESVWTWQGPPSNTIAALAGKPFNRLWRWDHIPEPFWSWEPGNGTLNLPLPGNPKFRLWRWDQVPEPGWLWTPPRASVIEETTLGGKPGFRLWRWDEVPEPVWTWQAPPSGTLQELAGQPFYRLWRWDIAEQLSWLWTPPSFIRRHGPPPRIDPLRVLRAPKLIRLLVAPPQDE